MKQVLKFALAGLATGYLLGTVMIGLAGCTTTAASTPAQPAQVTYTQACAAYGAAFATALELRRASKLNQAQIDQITILDSQVTPICTGPLPANPTQATVQITSAVTALAIIEAVKSKE